VEHDGFQLVVDLGYATLPALLSHVPASEVDAVLVSHGHPDHCADLNPLLRARALAEDPPSALPVYAPPGALDAVLALDRPGLLDAAYDLRAFTPGDGFELGPFRVATRLLPHWLPNAGVRLTAGAFAIAYTGDTGPSPEIVALAGDSDLLIAEATYPDSVPVHFAAYLSSAQQAGEYAAKASARRLLLNHLWPGTDPARSVHAARRWYAGPVEVATGGIVVDLADPR
jgi:ribonuclease BN (tRNA processing enzyme)